MFQKEIFRDLSHIQFGLLSAEEIISQSVCEVSHLKLTGPNSVYDERMGTLEVGKKCVTCHLDNKNCVGHFGHIHLKINILHPLFHKLALSILKCICYKCSRVLLGRDQLELNNLLKFHKQMRFHKIMEKMDRVDYCAHCDTMQPRYVFSSQDRYIYMIFKIDGESSRIQMMENEIYKIFENVDRDDISLLGFDPEHFHPKSLVLTVLPVLPPVARPYIIADNMTCDDDLTIQYLEIVKANHHIGELSVADTKRQKYIQTLKFKIKSLFDNSGDRQRVSNGRPLKGIKKRLTGKEGIIRNNLMGKRVDKSARTVIGPDPTLGVDEIAIPPQIANTLSYSVQVTDHNMDAVYRLIDEGRANFLLRDDGNIRINIKYATVRQGTKLHFGDMIRRPSGEWVLVKTEKDLFTLSEGDHIFRHGEQITPVIYNSRKKLELKVGDVIERRLQDGDILFLNRQPTLHRGSMIAQKVKIRPGKTIRLNLAITTSFNADFDGDEMNLHCPASPETEAELRLLSSVEQNIISNQSSKANIIIVQDALLGNYLMTKKQQTPLTREQFYQVASVLSWKRLSFMEKKIQKYHTFTGTSKDHYDGRMLFSLLLPDNFFYENKNDADPEEPVVIIREGILCTGAVKKTNLGSSHKSLITLLYQEYGENVCIEFLNDVQYLANQYLLLIGFSVGISDCIVTKKDEIQTMISRSFLKAKSIEEYTKDKHIREIYVLYALSGARDTGMAIAKNALKQDNRFLSTVISGAKGDYFNIAQITGILGQQNLNGQRIPALLSNQKRTLPHYPIDENHYTDDMRYESAGFIRSSFVHGLSPREYFFHAMTGREGITDTAMKSVIGSTRILLIENDKLVLTEIGTWIDDKMRSLSHRIQHFQEKQMELLSLEDDVCSIPSTDEYGNVSWCRITALTRHDPGHALYHVETETGREVTVTECRSLIVWEEESESFVEKPTTDVVLGDYLPVTLFLEKPPLSTDQSIHDVFAAEDDPIRFSILSSQNKKLWDFNTRSIREPETLLVKNDVCLDRVVRMTKVDPTLHPKVYDMTVPLTLNFGLANGLQVRDTATSGYIQRRMIKIAEDIQVKYDGTVRNSVNNIIQYAYGENFLDPMHTTFLDGSALPCDVHRLVERMNHDLT